VAAREPFENAVALVQAWLDGSGSAFARRVTSLNGKNGHAWDIDLRDPSHPVQRVRLSLPPRFPTTPCELHVDSRLCLQLPHIETSGRVCLGLPCAPVDYEDPVFAVERRIRRFQEDLLEQWKDVEWVQEQFHAERLSYWSRFCEQRHAAGGRRTVIRTTYAELDELRSRTEVAVASYLWIDTNEKRNELRIFAVGKKDPCELARRHGWALGTFVRGHALVVRISDGMRWTPQTWPKDAVELETLVKGATDGKQSVAQWLATIEGGHAGKRKRAKRHGRKDKDTDRLPLGSRPLLAVLVQGGVLYGYQLLPPTVPLVTAPSILPFEISRVDPTWCLTRDHNTAMFDQRRNKKILLIGAGSLGSPAVEALARAGVGYIDIIDSELMEGPNTSRHTLGISHLRQAKGPGLAAKLKEAVPGVEVHGYQEDASAWLSRRCAPGHYDLVVDCTGEPTVRTLLSRIREEALGDCPIVHAWIEPHCAAAHVVLTQPAEPWPADDPADELINAGDFSAARTRVELPACGNGFHPYGPADVLQAAGFAAERILAILDDQALSSTVWSWVRSKAFFDSLGVPITTRSIVPTHGTVHDAVTLTRELADVLRTR
jgi:hypothetical protein